jgi:ABC-type phosphate transport system substrate-binding protein
MKKLFLQIGLVGAILLGGLLPARDLDGVVIIVNSDVPEQHINAESLRYIYTGKTTYWNNGQKVVIGLLSGNSTDEALQAVSGMNPGQFKTFWQRLVFSGRGQQPKKVQDEAALVSLVLATPGAIALVPASADLKGARILKID